jgi:hypothetical protein
MKVSLNSSSHHAYTSMTALSASLRNAESCVHLMESKEGNPVDCIPIPTVEVKPLVGKCDLFVNVSCPICGKVMVETTKEIYNRLMSFNESVHEKSVSSTKNVEDNYSKI